MINVLTILTVATNFLIFNTLSKVGGGFEILIRSLISYNLFIRNTYFVLTNFFDSIDKKITEDDDILPGELDSSMIEIVKETNVKFEDVAGNFEAKEELQEIVQFLKDPKIFTRLGATIPKGVLLGGPPGTGKTLLAKAVAGEAGTPFLKASGSQFIELLVGVGAGRIRELFEKARSLKPAIIFIDEIDSIARARSSNANMGGGSNDEREQTLNQILTEMDGFEVDTGIVVIAATNRIDILDSAIKRPGRFDRQVLLSNPTLTDREAILKVHSKGKKIDKSVSLSQVAQQTIGFSGADLANLMNEAAILATRRKRNAIFMNDITDSIDRILIGLKGNTMPRMKYRQSSAFREIGRSLLTKLLKKDQNIQKITLVSRGNKQGNTILLSPSSQYTSRKSFINEILIAISSRVNEEIINGSSECTTRAEEDLERITRNLRTMIVRYAMTRLQQLKQETQQRNLYLLGSDVKYELNNTIDNFMTNFIDLTYKDLSAFFQFIRPGSERLVDELLISEEISGNILANLTREYLSLLLSEDSITNTRNSLFIKLVLPYLKEEIEKFRKNKN